MYSLHIEMTVTELLQDYYVQVMNWEVEESRSACQHPSLEIVDHPEIALSNPEKVIVFLCRVCSARNFRDVYVRSFAKFVRVLRRRKCSFIFII